MARKLKVFGGLTFMGRHQRRTIVGAETQKEAATRLGVSMYEFTRFWGETGNPAEVAAGKAQPHTVLIQNSQNEFVTKEEWTL